MNTFETTVKHMQPVARGTIEVVFNRPDRFRFNAGQHTQVRLQKLAYTDPRGPSRVFTISSSPENKDEIAIIFRYTGSGYKKTLMELKPSSKVIIQEASGFFTLPDNGEHTFIAGGIGIAPFISMIRTVNKLPKSNLRIKLLYANKSKESAAYTEELQGINGSLENFSLHNSFGRIQIEDIKKSVSDIKNMNWWIVGPPAMVADIRSLLNSMGVYGDKIFTEEFSGY